MAGLDFASHCERSRNHLDSARRIIEQSDEWAVVALFYSAYHAMKAALINDPAFDSMTDVKKLNPHLTPGDRFVTQHKVRRTQAGFGVNELVQILYPQYARDYERLHQASIQVRYHKGNHVYPVGDLVTAAQRIHNDLRSGIVVCSPI